MDGQYSIAIIVLKACAIKVRLVNSGYYWYCISPHHYPQCITSVKRNICVIYCTVWENVSAFRESFCNFFCNHIYFHSLLLHNFHFINVINKHTLMSLTSSMKCLYTVKEVCLTPICNAGGRDQRCMANHHWKRYKGRIYAASEFLFCWQ